jgi:hypothetical protein
MRWIGHTHVTLNHQYYAPEIIKQASRGVPAVFAEPRVATSSDYYNVIIFWMIVTMVYYCQYKIMFTNAGHVNHDVIDILASQPAQPLPGQPTVLVFHSVPHTIPTNSLLNMQDFFVSI